jgi:chromosome segregation protein
LEAGRALDALTAEVKVLESLAAEVPEGAVLSRLRIPEGMARALAAALGDDLLATDDPEAPLRWRDLGQVGEEDAAPLPEGAVPLLDPAEAPAALARRLGRVGVVAEERAADLQQRLRPGQRLVSRAGGLWRWDGLVRAPEAEEAGAARLRHRLRLDAARQELPVAEAALARATDAERERAAALAEARRALAGAEGAWREADATQTRARQRLASGRERAAELAAEADRLVGEDGGLAREREELDRERAALPAVPARATPGAAGDDGRAARAEAEAAEGRQREATRRAGAAEQALALARKGVAEARPALDAARREAERRRGEAEAAAREAAEAAAGRRARAEALASEHAELVTALAGMAEQRAAAETVAAAALEQLRVAEGSLGRARGEREAAARALAASHDREARLVSRLDGIGTAGAVVGQRLEDARGQAAAFAARAARVEAELAAANSPADVGGDAAALDAAIVDLESRRGAADTALREAEAGLAKCERGLAAAEAATADARERLALAKEARARAGASLDAAVAAVRERSQRRPEELLAEPGTAAAVEAADAAALEPRLERLRAARERIGAVNLRAAAEADELRGWWRARRPRRTSWRGGGAPEPGDRAAEPRGPRAPGRGVRGRGRALRDLFGRLFGGGRAQLRLIDGDDPLESGLELEASPPGKRLSSITLLSGGEKTLAALALVFAFFLAQPSPLCVLDEVDAPLDDANVDRFVSLMREIAPATGTRFLVVTHHPLTMARMDRLYGVTMSERGVSRLVSVALADGRDRGGGRRLAATA